MKPSQTSTEDMVKKSRPPASENSTRDASLCVGVRIRVIRPSLLNGCCANEKGQLLSITWLEDGNAAGALYICEMDRPGKSRLVAFRLDEIERDA